MGLKDFNKRDKIGLVAWGIVGAIGGGFAAWLASGWSVFLLVCILAVMFVREAGQSIINHARFEWEDVLRYYMVILLGAFVGFAIYQIF